MSESLFAHHLPGYEQLVRVVFLGLPDLSYRAQRCKPPQDFKQPFIARPGTTQQFSRQISFRYRRQQLTAQCLPDCACRELSEPPVAPAQNRRCRNTELLREFMTSPQTQSGTQCRGKNHDRPPVHPPTQKPHRCRRASQSTIPTAEAQTGRIWISTADKTTRLALEISLMKRACAPNTPLLTNRSSVIIVDLAEERIKRWIPKYALAHNGKVSRSW